MSRTLTASFCVVAAASAWLAAGCAGDAPNVDISMNQIAERYVKLVLKVGQHDADYVDAYYGDESWKPAGAPTPLATLTSEAQAIRQDLGRVTVKSSDDELVRLRRDYLDRQLSAIESRLAMLGGRTFSFDEESQRLYDAQAPHKTEADFKPVLNEVEKLLPGKGSLVERYAAFRAHYVIPKDKVDAVFRAAIDGCRSRTQRRVKLPEGEQFTVEYVTGKPWSAYNWYKGRYRSVIQVNTELPITIDRAIDLACHEGYPGHHVYNALLEKTLVRDRGWVEYGVYPLFSPQSLIAEGTANLGIEVAFPGDERTAFERDVLYPAAGLDPKTAATYAAVQHQIDALSYAGNEAARRYLNGEIDRAGAAAWLQQWGMMPKDRALQRIAFFDKYRSYVINYNYGRDLARAFIEKRGGTVDHPDVRWKEFATLLASPRLPSGLK